MRGVGPPLLESGVRVREDLSGQVPPRGWSDSPPGWQRVVICSDFNSKPGSAVHRFLSGGSVDARRVAPWHKWERAAAVAVDSYHAGRNSSSGLFSLQESPIFLSRGRGELQQHATASEVQELALSLPRRPPFLPPPQRERGGKEVTSIESIRNFP